MTRWYTFNVYTESGTIQISAKTDRYEMAEAMVIKTAMDNGYTVTGYAEIKKGMKL